MIIEQELEIGGLRFRMMIQSKSVLTHSKMQLLTNEDRARVKESFRQKIVKIFEIIKERELGK